MEYLTYLSLLRDFHNWKGVGGLFGDKYIENQAKETVRQLLMPGKTVSCGEKEEQS